MLSIQHHIKCSSISMQGTITTFMSDIIKFLLTPCLLGIAGGEVELGSGDLGGSAGYPVEEEGPSFCGSGGSSEDIFALREGCWPAVCALVLAAMGGRPEVPEPPDTGEFFRFRGIGAPPPWVGGVTCLGFGIGIGAEEVSD